MTTSTQRRLINLTALALQGEDLSCYCCGEVSAWRVPLIGGYAGGMYICNKCQEKHHYSKCIPVKEYLCRKNKK